MGEFAEVVITGTESEGRGVGRKCKWAPHRGKNLLKRVS
jgi:hypothetical protein